VAREGGISRTETRSSLPRGAVEPERDSRGGQGERTEPDTGAETFNGASHSPVQSGQRQTNSGASGHATNGSGKIFLPESAPWVSDFVEEMACFPNGIHDDVVDATTQALNYLREQPQVSTIELGYSMFGQDPRELDREALWEKAMRGYPMTQEEIERM
jgi:hypothetical protein